MPIYQYECEEGHVQDRSFPMSSYPQLIDCWCGKMGRKILSPTRINCDIEPYACPVTGKMITSRKQHEENLRRTGSRVLEKGEMQEYQRRRQAEEQRLEQSIERETEQFFEKLPQKKKEQLSAELLSGATAEVVRG